MRILMTTRGSSGHLLPLTPIAHAARRAGHEVLVAAQRQHGANVERAGLPLAAVADPPAEEWMPLLGGFAQLRIDEANAIMVGEFFAGIDTRAALPGLLDLVERWRPELIVRESGEFGSTIAADRHGIPLVRVGLGLATLEDQAIDLAAPTLDSIRVGAGLPADPGGERLRAAAYLSFTPEAIEPALGPAAPSVHRLRAATPAAAPPLPDWWPESDDPLVYLTFGSVAAGTHLPFFPALYRAAIDAIAALPVRLLVTVGQDPDLAQLGSVAPNVRVERWVPQDAVLARAAAIVCHGGYGTTLGALAHGVPMVIMPLFSADQWANADAVARVGAGVALDGERQTRRGLDLPAPETLDALAPAVRGALEEGAYRRAARRVAEAIGAMPPVEAAVPVLEEIAGRASA